MNARKMSHLIVSSNEVEFTLQLNQFLTHIDDLEPQIQFSTCARSALGAFPDGHLETVYSALVTFVQLLDDDMQPLGPDDGDSL